MERRTLIVVIQTTRLKVLSTTREYEWSARVWCKEHENKKEEDNLKEHNTKKVKGDSQEFLTESSKTSLSD